MQQNGGHPVTVTSCHLNVIGRVPPPAARRASQSQQRAGRGRSSGYRTHKPSFSTDSETEHEKEKVEGAARGAINMDTNTESGIKEGASEGRGCAGGEEARGGERLS